MAKGCLHGGVLSPLLWSLVMDDLWELHNDDYYAVEYADDIAILINEKLPQHIRGLTDISVYSPTVVSQNIPIHQSQQDSSN